MVTATSQQTVETFRHTVDTFQPPALDMVKLQAFMGKTMTDISGTMVSLMCAIGDRLGLFKSLGAGGPATSAELAERANIGERYAREWLSTLASAAYLEYDAASQPLHCPPSTR